MVPDIHQPSDFVELKEPLTAHSGTIPNIETTGVVGVNLVCAIVVATSKQIGII